MSELDIKSSTIDKSLDAVKGFLQKLVGPSVDEMGLLLSDNVKLWRLKNQLRNLEKVKTIVEKENINTKQVNLKVLFPYLEGVSLEDDNELQDLWANLFVNYIDADKNLRVNVYPSVLSQLSTQEVTVLKFLMEEKAHYIGKSKTVTEINAEDEVIANLSRLGLIEDDLDVRGNGRKRPEYYLEFQGYKLSVFGYSFFEACTRNKKN